MSSALQTGFRERLEEVETYLDLLLALDSQTKDGPPKIEGVSVPISTQQLQILYSSVYLHLYNLVESTMTLCIQAVCDATNESNRWRPSDLAEPLLREWVRSVARTNVELNADHRLEVALDLCRQLVEALPLRTFSIAKGGGGNWDDDEIEAISKRLGLVLGVSQPVYRGVKQPIKDDMGPLTLVKTLRNRLAHGDISFAQCSEGTTVGQLVDLKERTVKYLLEVIANFDTFLATFEFLRPEKRPA